eukprot:3202910-Amphidinium_carterae.1
MNHRCWTRSPRGKGRSKSMSAYLERRLLIQSNAQSSRKGCRQLLERMSLSDWTAMRRSIQSYLLAIASALRPVPMDLGYLPWSNKGKGKDDKTCGVTSCRRQVNAVEEEQQQRQQQQPPTDVSHLSATDTNWIYTVVVDDRSVDAGPVQINESPDEYQDIEGDESPSATETE